MTPHERALTKALGEARAEITRLRGLATQRTTPRADIVAAVHVAEAAAWLNRIGPDPDAARHLAELSCQVGEARRTLRAHGMRVPA
jgi:hypothetical protein